MPAPPPPSGRPDTSDDDLSARGFVVGLLLILALAAALRLVFPTADPPWRSTVGIVWHDEGAWVHNARNRALFGSWQLDAWNPLFIAPVFTYLEYLSFSSFGVGVWQARLVSELTGWLSVVALGLGVARLGGRRAGLAAAALLASNYVYVMYNRAALMEASMVAFIVYSWYGFVRAVSPSEASSAMVRASWGIAAGLLAMLAYFSKASAIFFVAALGLVALHAIFAVAPVSAPEGLPQRQTVRGTPWQIPDWRNLSPVRCGALWTLAGLAVAGVAALATFVIPNWSEYSFYNWQMSVTRKPSYDLQSFVNRASWFPIVHDFFTRMWLVTAVSLAALLGVLTRWRRVEAAELLLHAWIVVGAAELIVHDTGNERRLVFLIPAMAAMAALSLLRDRRLLPASCVVSRRALMWASPAVLFALYMLWGGMARLPFLYEIRPGVRLSAALAMATGLAVYVAWPALSRWLTTQSWTPGQGVALVALVVIGDLAQFGQWSLGRSYKNYEASVELGKRLPPGTLVHGKLSNGLALENRIRPVFVGRDFGNYRDRFDRNDIRYLLTYTAPRLGYEGPVIRDVVDAYPQHRVLWTFDVRETTSGLDQAALIEKGPPGPRPSTDTPTARAKD
jgi:hypothetical protein